MHDATAARAGARYGPGMSRLRNLNVVATIGLLLAGALCLVADLRSWASFDAALFRPTIRIGVALPGVPLLACGAAWLGALFLAARGSRPFALACCALAFTAMITSVIQTRLRINALLEQATIISVPPGSIHTTTSGTMAAIAALATTSVVALALGLGWVLSGRRAGAIRRLAATTSVFAVVAASCVLLGAHLDPYSSGMVWLGAPNIGGP